MNSVFDGRKVNSHASALFESKKGAIFFKIHTQKLRRRIGGFRESPIRRPFSFQGESADQKGGVACQKYGCAKHVSEKEEQDK
ncbi:hypothetical protein [uncultured Oscillibacter sp.]|uniref:hypothetical protein n=1 Tax=uncultured Oscillibacter sp. TaxID=876091 RepID=UPI002805CDCE|nr:hypothetical protein [uncultured Oscillibacter sp.]